MLGQIGVPARQLDYRRDTGGTVNRSLGRFSPLSNFTVGLALALLLALVLSACGGGPQEPTPQPPKAASDVSATPGPGYITVSWTDNSDDETGFKIMRSAAAGSSSVNAQQATEIASVGANVTTYVDNDIEFDQGYQYSVVAHNSAGGADQANAPTAATVPVGVDLIIGTNNRTYEEANGTIFLAYFVFPESVIEDGAPFEVTISGPSGWNNDREFNFSLTKDDENRRHAFGSYNRITAVNGSYQMVVVVDGTTYQASYELAAADFSLNPPTDIVATGDANSINVTWSNPAGGRSALVSAWKQPARAYVAGYDTTNLTEHSFTGLTIEDGIYNVEVATVNVDLTVDFPVKREPLGLSYDSVTFGIGDVMSPLCASANQVVTIPDAALLGLVRSAIEMPTGPITCEQMTLLVNISAFDAGVASLEGLEYAANLFDLDLTGSNVDDITPITSLENLRSLNLNANPVTDISQLSNLVNLNSLHLGSSGVSFVDPTPLEELVRLEYLNIGGRQIDDATLEPILTAMPNMKGLWLYDNDISDGSVFTNLAELDHLDVRANNIEDLTFMSGMPILRSLVLTGNPVADFTPLEARTQLQYLVLTDTGLSDIGFLADFTLLRELDLSFNNIASISALVANTGIGEGDIVNIVNNALDLDDPGVMADIHALLDRGVDLTYLP